MQSAGHSHKQVVRRTQHFERRISFVVDWKSKRLCWMQSEGRSQVQVARVYGKGSFETRSQAAPLQASTVWNIHESPWLMIPIPAALVCPKTCDTLAEDACNIASHHSGSLEADMSESHRAYSSVKGEVLPFFY